MCHDRLYISWRLFLMWQSRYSNLNFSQVIINSAWSSSINVKWFQGSVAVYPADWQLVSAARASQSSLGPRAFSALSLVRADPIKTSDWLREARLKLPRVSEYSIDLLLDCGLGNGNLIQHKLFRSMRKFYHPSINLGQGCFAREL